MERDKKATEVHVLALPFPAQGHINPMLQFSKRLASKGHKVTLVTFLDNHKFINLPSHSSNITIESIPDKTKENNVIISTMKEYWKHLSSMVKHHVVEIAEKQPKVSCLVYDSIMPWALEIAKQLGVPAASFFTQSCAVSAIYYHAREGNINIPLEHDGFVTLDGMPPLESCDLPSSRYNMFDDCPGLVSLMAGQFSNLKEANWILFNSFNSLEEDVMNWMEERKYPIKLVGPIIPSKYLDKRLEDDNDYGISLFKPKASTCIQWLDSKEANSVVYVAFGSLAAWGEKQMEEVANGLKRSNYQFLWVVRESEEKKLPHNFANETSEKGLVVGWCHQLEVLSHRSIGCFITHCGWNSTLEALSLGVPMVAMPLWSDQLTNAKFISDVWRVGVRVKVNGEGLITMEEIDCCITQVMEGEFANQIRNNSEKWKKLAHLAVGEGGTSDNNIDEFVKQLQYYWK